MRTIPKLRKKRPDERQLDPGGLAAALHWHLLADPESEADQGPALDTAETEDVRKAVLRSSVAGALAAAMRKARRS